MPGPLPKPADQRRRKNEPTYKPVVLPSEGRQGPAPKLPNLRSWKKQTKDAWNHWWSTPQATMWDQSGSSLHRWALLYDMLVCREGAMPAINAQLTAIEDRHGFSPQAMAKLRWSVAADEVSEKRDEQVEEAASVRRLKPVADVGVEG